jgi:hypothetical protein
MKHKPKGDALAWTIGLVGIAAATLGGVMLLSSKQASASPSPPPPGPGPRPSPQPNPGGGYTCPDGTVVADPTQCTYPTDG